MDGALCCVLSDLLPGLVNSRNEVHLFPTVCQQMRLQMYGLTECFVALYTFLVLLSAVNEQVPLQIYNFTEGFAAIWTKMHLYPTVCQSKWVFRCPASLNDLLHSAHLCDFSLLWMSMWVFRFTAWLNDLLHSEHICVTSLQCESTYGWPVGWNIWMTWHTSCKDVSLLCPRSDLFSCSCLLTMTEESLSPLFIWSVRPLKKSTMYHLHHDSVVVVRLFFTL